MSLPEEVASQLNSKVQRINVLQKLVLQEKVHLGAKPLGTSAKNEIDLINEEVREFLLGLLASELGTAGSEDQDPFEAIGIEMTPEKAQALNALLDRMVAPKVLEQEENQQRLPPPSPRAFAPKERILSPVLAALRSRAGGDEEWEKLSSEERSRRIKEIEKQSAITYNPTTK